MRSSDYDPIVSHSPQYLENLAPKLFERAMVSLSDLEEWDDEYDHGSGPHDPEPIVASWYQIEDHGDYDRLLLLKRKRKGKRNWRASADGVTEVTRPHPQVKKTSNTQLDRSADGVPEVARPQVKKTSKTQLDRIRKFCDTPQVKYLSPTIKDFEMLTKRYEEMNKVAELQIKKLETEIKQRQEWIAKLHKIFDANPIMVETIIKNNGKGKIVIPDPDSPEEFSQAAQGADQKIQKALALYETLHRS